MQPILLALFLAGYVALATLGAWTRLAFQWPAYLMLAVGGLLSLLRLRKGFKFAPSSLCLLSAFLFAAYLGARAWFSPVEYLWRQDLLSLASCLVAYTTFALHVEHPKYRRWFVVTLAVLIVASFAIGVYQSQYDRTWSPYTWLGYARSFGPKDAGGFFHSENHLAGFLEGSAFFLMAFCLFGRVHLAVRMLALFGFILAGITLTLTYSRGGLASGLAGLGFFGVVSLWLYGKFLGPQFWKYLLAFGALFVLLGGFLVFLCFQFLESTYAARTAMDNQFRIALAKLAVDQWKLSPVWGTGARTYEIYAREFTTSPDDWNGAQAVDPTFAHNDYAQLLGDYGAVGLALGLLLLGAHLGNGLRFLVWYRNVRYERTGDIFSNSLALGLGALCAVAAYTLHSVIDFNLHIPANALLVAGLLGMLANPGYENDVRRFVRLPGLKTALSLLTALAAGWTLWLGWRCAPAELSYERGVTRSAVGDYLGALPHFRRASELDPAHFLNRLAFGGAFVGLAQDSETAEIPVLVRAYQQKAIEQFDAARALNPQDAVAHANLAEQLSLIDRDHADEAERHYLQAIRLAPALNVLRGRYGFHLLRHGRLDEAAEVFEETIAMKWYDQDSMFARNITDKIRSLQNPNAPKLASPPPPAPPGETSPADPPIAADPGIVPPPEAEPEEEKKFVAPPPRTTPGLLSLPDPKDG